MNNRALLKKDVFGEVWTVTENDELVVLRDARPARWPLGWIARALLRREARALAALAELDAVPELLRCEKDWLTRDFITGVPLFESKTQDAQYFQSAQRLLRQIHRAHVVHNDLAKEPNVLVRSDGSPAFIDFQLAWHAPHRGLLFRRAAREDIRHLLKHKRSYRPDLLTTREQNILNTPSPVSRLWMSTFKPVYLFVTRRLFGWADREGAADRGRQD